MDAVRFDDVSLALAGRLVLRGVDLAIGAGEFIGVLGANGAGKTTLFRAILGLIAPVAGRITVLGGPPRQGQSGIGYLPQTRTTPGAAALCGRDLLLSALDGHRWGWPRANRARLTEVERVLALTGAEALADRRFDSISGGERQRLMLAQALLGAPRLLLLDEPLASLDPRRQTEVVALVREVQRRTGLPVLFSAHDLNPLLGSLDRVLYLGGGGAAIGTADEVVTGPVLSRLYGTPVDVVRLDGRVFVIAGTERLDQACGHCAPLPAARDQTIGAGG